MNRFGWFANRASCAMVALAAMATHVEAAPINERLAELGHPDTTMCQLGSSSHGLRGLPVVQFRKRGSQEENEQEAIAILKIMAGALNGAGQRYVGFQAARRWEKCGSRDPQLIFWRDYDDGWRLVQTTPLAYLRRIQEQLPTERRGTAAEAYVLWSLGLVEQRLGDIPASIQRFEAAYALLDASEDSHSIMAYLLAPLIHYHFGAEGNEAKGQTYLEAYALIAEASPTEGVYLPLVKTAPAYPLAAQRAGLEGYVLLEFTVGADGKVQDPIVIEASPAGTFDNAAIEAARLFRYVPKVVDGVLVPVPGVRNLISFEIR